MSKAPYKSRPNDIKITRYDIRLIASWIEPASQVLSLGCGEGDLLYFLKTVKGAICTGIEQDELKVAACIEKGLNVIQGDLNEEILDYSERTFDYVILSQTLQQIYHPASVIRSMLRIGDKGIVSFPNFSHWSIRFQLLLSGRAPVSPQLPYQWHDTPNIRVITIKDFRRYSQEVGFRILREIAIDTDKHDREGKNIRFLPNLRSTYGIFLIGRK